jgi:hypothetical protein
MKEHLLRSGVNVVYTSTSMSLRDPNVMRWTRLMDECLEALENSPAALPSDKVLCRHIRLQHITEEFAMHSSAEETSPDKSRAVQIQTTHREFKRQLDEWHKDVADGCWDGKSSFFLLPTIRETDQRICYRSPRVFVLFLTLVHK